ncbi:GAF domain-containing protein [Streptomyces sp. NPDC048231]|uniref:GAF domain-containing protein n=1 Tax=Streptomyces sp. NPDC048231 TaxID=3365519 RepID=UPI003718C1DD
MHPLLEPPPSVHPIRRRTRPMRHPRRTRAMCPTACRPHAERLRDSGIHALLLLPLHARGTVLGVLSLYRGHMRGV